MTAFWLLIACANPADKAGDSAADTAASIAPQGQCDASWDAWASGFFTTYCSSCHSLTSDTRYGAPTGVDFDNRQDVQTWSARVRVRVLADQTMPLGGGVTEDELMRLDTWLQCLETQP